MATFVEATGFLASGDGRYRVEIDSEWAIWGPNGGYLAGIAMRCMTDHSPLPRPATFACQFLSGGASGAATVEVVVLRAARRAQCLQAVLVQGGTPLLNAVSWMTSDAIDGLAHLQAGPTGAPRPDELPPYAVNHAGAEDRSPMWQHVDRRPLHDNRAMFDPDFERPDPPNWRCWHGLIEDVSGIDNGLRAARALLWADIATWPAVSLQHGWPMAHIAPTLDLNVSFHTHLFSGDSVKWSFVEGQSANASGGLVSGSVSIWSPVGRLEATGISQGLCRPDPTQ